MCVALFPAALAPLPRFSSFWALFVEWPDFAASGPVEGPGRVRPGPGGDGLLNPSGRQSLVHPGPAGKASNPFSDPVHLVLFLPNLPSFCFAHTSNPLVHAWGTCTRGWRPFPRPGGWGTWIWHPFLHLICSLGDFHLSTSFSCFFHPFPLHRQREPVCSQRETWEARAGTVMHSPIIRTFPLFTSGPTPRRYQLIE